MKHLRTEGIIIKRRNIGEADRLLTVFTKTDGKIIVKARGIRKIPSRRSAHVELLNLASLSLYKGSKFPVLTEATSLDTFSDIKNDLNKVGFAYHICELIDGLCPENQENRAVFTLLHNVLVRLEKEEEIVEVIHGFEVELLTVLGYWGTGDMQQEQTNVHFFIENILERRLKSRRIFEKFS